MMDAPDYIAPILAVLILYFSARSVITRQLMTLLEQSVYLLTIRTNYRSPLPPPHKSIGSGLLWEATTRIISYEQDLRMELVRMEYGVLRTFFFTNHKKNTKIVHDYFKTHFEQDFAEFMKTRLVNLLSKSSPEELARESELLAENIRKFEGHLREGSSFEEAYPLTSDILKAVLDHKKGVLGFESSLKSV